MEIILFIAGAVIGIIASWVIAHAYYKKSFEDQGTLFNKLSEDTRQVILSDKRVSLSIQELNELLEEKTVDRASDDPLPYIACPKCGSPKLVRRGVEYPNRDDTHYVIYCPLCNWTDWTQ